MIEVPVTATQNQTLDILLSGQNVQISLAQKAYGMIMSVSVSNSLIVSGVLCLDRNRIVRSAYLGFIGDFFFYDAVGIPGTLNPPTDPYYTGLGSRYFLIYLEPTDPLTPGPQ